MAGNYGQIKGITVEISGNTTKLNDALKETNAAAKSTQQELNQINRQLKYDPTNVTLIAQKHEVLGKRIEEAKSKLQTLKTAQDQFDQSALQTEQGAAQYRALQREIAKTEGNLKYLEEQYRKTDSATVSLDAVATKIDTIGQKSVDAGKNLTTHITAPLTAVGAASLKSFEDVESGLDIVTEKTGASGKALEQMQGYAEGLAMSLGVSFEDAGTAVGEINTRFGLTGQTLQSVSADFLQFAKINGVDVNSSIDQVQKAMASFGVDAKDAGTVLDVLNRVGQNTGISMDSLEQELIDNGAAFQSMGLNINQSATLLGEIDKSGADSSAVMTGLSKALKNATDQGIPLDKALAQVQDQILNGTDSMDGLSAAYDLFGAKAGGKVYQAVKSGTLNFKDLASSTDDASGSVKKVYDNTDKFGKQIQKLKNQAQVILAEIGKGLVSDLLPVLKDLQTSLKGVLENFKSMDKDTRQSIIRIALIAAAIGPLLVAVGSFAKSISSVIHLMSQIRQGFLLIKEMQIAAKVVGACKKMGSGLSNLFTLISTHPVIAVTVAIVAALIYLYTHCESFRNAVNAILQGLYTTVTSVWGMIKAVLTTAITFIASIPSTIWGFLSAVINFYVNFYTTIFTYMMMLLQAVGSIFGSLWSYASGGVMALINNTIAFFINLYNSGASALNSLLWYVGSWAGSLWSYASGGVSSFVSSVWSTFSVGIGNLGSSMYRWGADMIDGLVRGLRAGIRHVRQAASDLADTIRSYLHFSRPDVGPLRDYESWMPDMVHGLATSLQKAMPELDQVMGTMSGSMAGTVQGRLAGATNTNNYSYGNISIEINAKDGQNARQIAKEVQKIIVHDIQRNR